MKKIERITKRIESDKDILKGINNVSFYGIERFIDDGIRYIKAIKEGRMINNIEKVSASGMSRTMKFLSCEKGKNNGEYYYCNYFAFFKSLGFQVVGDRSHYFRIHGCGMDMVFHTNYTNIHVLHRLGFLNKKECDHLAQQTPTTI